MVQSMVSYGIPLEEVASVMSVSVQMLTKWCSREIDTAVPIANAKVASFLYTRATGQGPDERANVTAAIFWAKTRMRWTERQIQEHVTPDGQGIQITVTIPPDLTVLTEQELAELYRRIAQGDPFIQDDPANVVPFKRPVKRLSDVPPL